MGPGCKIFINNLSWQTTWQTLKDHFNTDGQVAYAAVFSVKRAESTLKGHLLGLCSLFALLRIHLSVRSHRTADDCYAQMSAQGITLSCFDKFALHTDKLESLSQLAPSHNKPWMLAFLREVPKSMCMMQEPSGRSKGNGVIEFSNAEAAQQAIDSQQGAVCSLQPF